MKSLNEETDQLHDYLGKVSLVKGNLETILGLADLNFDSLKNSLKSHPNYPKDPTQEQLIKEKTTAMFFQLAVGHLYNLTEIIIFLKRNHHCDDLFESNKILDEFDSNTRLICEVRNNIVLHGHIQGKNFRGVNEILSDLSMSREESIKKIWISVRCAIEICIEILNKFSDIPIEDKIVSPSMNSKEEIDIIQIYFDAKQEFNNLTGSIEE